MKKYWLRAGSSLASIVESYPTSLEGQGKLVMFVF